MHSAKILLVEDEQAIADTLIYALGSEGFSVPHILLGREALPAHRGSPFDLIILDVGLPDTTGFEVLKELRAHTGERADVSGVPVIFLTARSEEIDRILGLKLGADDYVVKPFSPREVAARARAILRLDARLRNSSNSAAANAVSRHEPESLRIAFHGKPVERTRYEYLLLALLLSAPGRVFTREQIMNRVWANAPDPADRRIDTHSKTLCAQLPGIDALIEPILTHRGTGYSLAA